ncbi:hypothetical protein 031MP004_72 [Bacillus phage 031MP004]|nr:hypothetical protein 022DV001_71 [Bacillus phage 022DV001]QFG05473.1 hypothetical protein 031MP003_74 [Bacillus phage 031MP003]QFG05562.1 hypothetical protein 031MP002_73 [Bacillus phage 031MP002]QFG05649.1 hypothetical protein 031MP004_72 [Bacillus phage 031MP004]QFG05821.1 hypothetical protein 055SW001_71 [Bacillus phage 055SW001]
MSDVEKIESPEVAHYDKIQSEELSKLAGLYAEAEKRDDNDPLMLQEKMTFYGMIYEIMGDMEALATGQEKLAYAYRQEVSARKFIHTKQIEENGSMRKLTGEERKAVAELAVRKYRRNEARFAEESKKWKNRRESVLEQINIMKRRQDLFADQWNKANALNGYS